MRLTDLEPRFVRYETRMMTTQRIVGDHETWRERGCPTKDVVGPVQFTCPVKSLGEAQGIRFLCPACYEKNNGRVGTHAIDVTFADRGVPDDSGSHNRDGKPSRWQVSGAGFDNLTLQPSIDCGCWHGFVTNGEAK